MTTTCAICGETFPSASGIGNHRRTCEAWVAVHPPSPPVVLTDCPRCGMAMGRDEYGDPWCLVHGTQYQPRQEVA